MKHTNILAVTTLALVSAFMVAPQAFACGSCNRAVLDDTVITQPAVIESSAPVVLSQPAVVTTTPVMTTNTFMVAPIRRHHLLNIDTPIGGLRLF